MNEDEISLKVIWDSRRQTISRLEFDHDQLKTWEFVQAILGMATQYADTNRRLAMARLMQEEAASDAFANKLIGR